MTREAFEQIPNYIIDGTGPYVVTEPYLDGSEILVRVLLNDVMIDLATAEFSVSPTSSDTAGAVYLSATAAATYVGCTLYLYRETQIEQGWAGSTARERGLEEQLDRLTQGVQELRDFSKRALTIAAGNSPPYVPQDGRAVVWNEEVGQFENGPNADEISDAQENAELASEAAEIATAAANLLESTRTFAISKKFSSAEINAGAVTLPAAPHNKDSLWVAVGGGGPQDPEEFDVAGDQLTIPGGVPEGVTVTAWVMARTEYGTPMTVAADELAYVDRASAVIQIGLGLSVPVGARLYAGEQAYTYVCAPFVGISDMPGWKFAGSATLAHWGIWGTDIGSDTYYHAVPAADEYTRLQEAFNFCVANGYNLVGDTTRVYGTATELNWGSTASVTPKGSAMLDNCSITWIGSADTAIDKSDPNPDNWPWTTNTPVLRVGNRAGDTDKYRVTLGPGVRVDGRRIKNCIQFRGLEDVDASALAVRGLDYEVLIGVPGNNSAATTDCKIKVRGWHYAYLENSSGVFGTDDGTGHYGPTGRTSSGVVVYSSDVFVEPHSARGKLCAVLGEGYGATIAPVSKLYSGPDRTSGIDAFLITPGAQRYTWLGADVQDGGIRVMSGNGKIIGLTLAQYTHNMITLVASAANETFEQFTLANCRFGGGAAAVTLETIGAGTWGSFAGTFYGNKNGNGEDMTIQGRKFNIGGTVDPFLSRADLVTAIGTYGWAPEVGTTVRIGALVWEYDGVSSGISDMPGWAAAGNRQPGHYTVNTTPGTTDMEAALEAAMADGNVTLPPEEFLISNQLSTQSNIRIRGEKGAQITKAAGDAVGPVYVLQAEQNFTVSRVDFDIAADEDATNGVYLVPWASSLSDYELDHVEATANITVDPSTGARNGLAGVVLVSNGATVDGFRIKDCHFENFFYGFLQSNSTSAAVTDLTIADTTFKDFGAPALLFNSPAAGSYNKRIMVNRVLLGANKTKYGTLGPGTGRGYPHRASFAGHNHYFLWTDVIAFGDGGEALRMEEDARAWVVSNMAAELNGQDGFEAIPNHAGDAVTVYRPTLGLFSGVALDNTGLTTASALGAGLKLWVYDSVSGLEDAETVGESVFTNWAVSGWAYGADLHQGAHRDFINNGIIVGTTSGDVGLRTKDPSHAHSHVMIFDCDTAVEFDRGGNIGKMFFRSKSGMPDPAEISVTGGVGIMDGWDWHAPRATYANGVTYQNIISIGDEVEGRLSLSIQDDDGTNCAEISGHLRWDGTNMDFRPDQSGGTAAGNISFTAGGPVGVQGTYLAVSITNSSGGDLDNLRLQVSLDGESSHKWS